jgi:acyl-CoA thioester hydrolase
MTDRRFLFSFPFRVRYSEVDLQGVVFNAHYLTYFDTALTEFMRHVGYDYLGRAEETGTDFHTVRSVVDYLAPIRFDQRIDVFVRVGRLGRSSLTFELEIRSPGEDRALARGEIVWVTVDRANHRPVAVPDDMAALFEAHERRPLRG